VVEPLRRDDCCLISDGAAAVVVMSERRARELAVAEPVAVLGFGQGNSSSDVTLRRDLTQTKADASAATAFRMAGLRPSDIDCAQIYDCFTVTVAMTLEAYGFGSPEALTDLARAGGFRLGGALPLNTSGGNLAECYMHGLGLVVEAVRQVRGESPNPVPDVKVSFVNAGPMVEVGSAAIFGTEEALG
jgi:acetyl-CoA acetyltransferase